jgi:hypothetical protein
MYLYSVEVLKKKSANYTKVMETARNCHEHLHYRDKPFCLASEVGLCQQHAM